MRLAIIDDEKKGSMLALFYFPFLQYASHVFLFPLK